MCEWVYAWMNEWMDDKFSHLTKWSVSITHIILVVNDVENMKWCWEYERVRVCEWVSKIKWKGERVREKKGYENIKLSLKAYLSK